MRETLIWDTIQNKKVAKYKGFTLTQSGHRVEIKDDLNILPDPGFKSLAGALAYIDSVHENRTQP